MPLSTFPQRTDFGAGLILGEPTGISVKGWIRSDRAVDGAVDLAVRFPVGLCYQFDAAPVDVFAETVPAIGLLPATCSDLEFARGGRYWP